MILLGAMNMHLCTGDFEVVRLDAVSWVVST